MDLATPGGWPKSAGWEPDWCCSERWKRRWPSSWAGLATSGRRRRGAPATGPARSSGQVDRVQEEHLRKRLRSTNLLERSFGEVKRRTKVIGRCPGETSCLSLCWAVMDLVIAAGRGLALTDFEHQQLAQMRTARRAQSDCRDDRLRCSRRAEKRRRSYSRLGMRPAKCGAKYEAVHAGLRTTGILLDVARRAANDSYATTNCRRSSLFKSWLASSRPRPLANPKTPPKRLTKASTNHVEIPIPSVCASAPRPAVSRRP